MPTIPAPEECRLQSARRQCDLVGWADASAATGGSYLSIPIMRRPVGAPAYVVLDDKHRRRPELFDKTSGGNRSMNIASHSASQFPRLNAALKANDSKPVEIFTRDIITPAQPAVCRQFSPAWTEGHSSTSPGPLIWKATSPGITSSAGSRAGSRRS